MEHSYEEIRKAALDILAEREKPNAYPTQYEHLRRDVGSILKERETDQRPLQPGMSQEDSELFLEVFWDFFRQGIITLGIDGNREFPFFHVSACGKRLSESQEAYFFHDLSSYETVITENIPSIDGTTLIYLKAHLHTTLFPIFMQLPRLIVA